MDDLRITCDPKARTRALSSRRNYRQTARLGLEEDVTFLAVLREVQTLNLFVLGDAQSHHDVQHLQYDNRSHDGQRRRGRNADRLVDELTEVAFENAAAPGVAGNRTRGEDTRQ